MASSQTLQQLVEDLKNGVMVIFPDVVIEGDDLPFDRPNAVFKSHQEIMSWVGPRIDSAYFQRLGQIDPTRSTVVGVALGERPPGHRVEVADVRYNLHDNLVTVTAVEKPYRGLGKIRDKSGVVQVVSFPFQVVRFLNAGNAAITINVVP